LKGRRALGKEGGNRRSAALRPKGGGKGLARASSIEKNEEREGRQSAPHRSGRGRIGIERCSRKGKRDSEPNHCGRGEGMGSPYLMKWRGEKT